MKQLFKNKILLLGGSGTLGKAIIDSNYFKNLDFPSKKRLNILNKKSIRKFLKKDYNLIINCAALARMRECENNPKKARFINVNGTRNLINEVKRYNSKSKNTIKIIHISTDAVYSSTKGNYKENSKLKPYNVYARSKYFSEKIVKKLKKYVIIRTRFFDKNKIRFNTAATDIFTSMIEVKKLVKEIKFIASIDFTGVINIGTIRESDFNTYKKHYKKIKPCKRIDILRNINFFIAKDASMCLKKFKKLKKKYG